MSPETTETPTVVPERVEIIGLILNMLDQKKKYHFVVKVMPDEDVDAEVSGYLLMAIAEEGGGRKLVFSKDEIDPEDSIETVFCRPGNFKKNFGRFSQGSQYWLHVELYPRNDS